MLKNSIKVTQSFGKDKNRSASNGEISRKRDVQSGMNYIHLPFFEQTPTRLRARGIERATTL